MTGESKFRRLGRSAIVGVVATVIDLALLFVLVDLVGLAPAVANVPSLAGGLIVQFVGNKYFAFGDRSKRLLKQGGQFALVEAGAIALNAVGFHLLVTLTVIPYVAVRLGCSAAVYFGFSYPLWHFIFSPRVRGASTARTAICSSES